MNRISFKIGLLFFAGVFLIESISMVFLHDTILHSRVHEELSALQTRGNNHREILEASYQEETIKHVALMESNTDTQVIITDPSGNIHISSNKVAPEMIKIIHSTPKRVNKNGLILQENWQDEPFIATVSPIRINGKINGYVYMFQKTLKLKELISELNRHFILAGVLSLIFMFILIMFLTRYVTHPLIKMSEATKRISKGDFTVSLPKSGKDELGVLGESIKVLAKELEILKNERNEFLASISHELRTPLTYIKGYAEIAKRAETQSKERQTYLGIIFEEAVKLTELVKELFHLAKMDENNFTIQKESVHLYPYFKAIYEKIAPAFKENNMELLLNCSEHIFAEIDPIRFEQVIINLLDNARKYSEPFTKVTLVVEELGEKVFIKVADQGKGIPEEDLPRIFERFYRVDKSRARTLGGTGLGLAIVKQLVDAHGGEINVASHESGTIFEIVLSN